jgi:hypothetical protein
MRTDGSLGKAEHVARFILLKTGLNVVFFAGGCL